MLSSLFFIIDIGFTCKKNSRKTFQRLFGRNPRLFVINSNFRSFKFHTFPGISQNLNENVSIFYWNDRHLSADSVKPNITGGIWMKYCTVAKSMGRDRPISVAVNGWARVACALRTSRSIPVAIFLNHDAQITAQTTRFWLRSKLP